MIPPVITWIACMGMLLSPVIPARQQNRLADAEQPIITSHLFPRILAGQGFLDDPLVASDSPSAVIPFNKIGNLIVVQAKVDTAEGNFILDTGAPGLILNMTYFRQYPASLRIDEEAGGVTGGIAAASPTDVDSLELASFRYSRIQADRINLGHIENTRGIRILGLLGMNLFKRFEMIIDYENNLIHLHLISKKEARAYSHEMLKDTAVYNEFPLDIKNNKLYTYGEVAGKKLTFIIDTGAESNILDSRLPDKILENVTINSRVLLAGTGSSKIEALTGDMKNMKMSGMEIGTLPVIVTNLEKMCSAYDDRCLDGLLGFDFLSLHKIGFNFVKRKMYIWK